jgi:hypothetical protein
MKVSERKTLNGIERIIHYGVRDIDWEKIEPTCYDGKKIWFEQSVEKDGIEIAFSNGRYGYEGIYNVTILFNGRDGISYECHRFEKKEARQSAYGLFRKMVQNVVCKNEK